ncbi:MAG: hypothetical protein NC432_01430 [Roseburia sp.]|nr:hypothetical protein [Roseburia sp.]MCM1098114.1 hypothetical protein [Ruminococcus flavefaciens]
MSIGKRIKSYWVFTSLWYRLILYLAVPLAMAGVVWAYGWATGIYSLLPVILLLILVEVLADHWFLGGIQEKGAEKLDYLKTSPRGMEVMKSALILDLARRFLETLAILVICCLLCGYMMTGGTGGLVRIVISGMIGGNAELNVSGALEAVGGAAEIGLSGAIGRLALQAFTIYGFSVAGTVITRFGSTLQINLIAGYIAALLGILCCALTVAGIWPTEPICFIMAFLSIASSVLAVRIAMKRVKEGYYDK